MKPEMYHCNATGLDVRLNVASSNRGKIRSCTAYEISQNEDGTIPSRECYVCEFNKDFMLKQKQHVYLEGRNCKPFWKLVSPAKFSDN